MIGSEVRDTLWGIRMTGRIAGSNGTERVEYADLPPWVGFAPKDEPLRKDINLLGQT